MNIIVVIIKLLFYFFMISLYKYSYFILFSVKNLISFYYVLYYYLFIIFNRIISNVMYIKMGC